MNRTARYIVVFIFIPFLLYGFPVFAASVELVTPSGPIRGIVTDGISAYKGVPFAKPPVGDLRFAPTENVVPWTQTLDCENFGATAVQQTPIEGLPMSEDCLTLNVWTPAKPGDTANLPVYVFIHGGAFARGGGAEPTYDGMNFARRGIVTITINYRMNALGFYATQETFDRYGTTGNWALLDQIKALEWIRDNVAAFGGDPKRVTIGGESAGSYSVAAMLLSPLAKGLFQGAIMESGTILSVAGNSVYARGDLKRSIEVTHMQSRSFGAADSAEGLAKLRAVDANPFAQMSPLEVDFTKIPAFFYVPVYDGRVIPKDPLKAMNEGNFNKVRLLCGFNADEGSLFIPEGTDELKYEMLAIKMFGYDRAQPILKRFPVNADNSSTQRARQILAYGMFTTDIKVFEDVFARNGLDVYAYQFDYVSPESAANDMGAMHGAELAYVFKNGTFDSTQKVLADNMHIRWANFIKNGDPNVGETPPSDVAWPKYDAQSCRVIRFNDTITADTMPNRADREFMQEMLFGDDPYYRVDNGNGTQSGNGGGCHVGTAGIAVLSVLGIVIATRRKLR